MPFWNTSSTTLTNDQMYVNNTYKDANGKNKLSTITATNTTGYKSIDSNSTDPLIKKLSYAVQTDGKITYQYDDGTGNKVQYNSIQEVANGQLPGYSDQTTLKLKDSMQRNLKSGVETYNQANPDSKINANQATTPPASGDGENQTGGSLNEAQSKALGEENQYKENTRAGSGAYRDDLKYPLDLKSEVQDTIRFTILEYSPSLSKENTSQGGTGQFGSSKKRTVTLESSGIPVVKGSTRIGTITLPIPAGISDGNTAGWQDDRLNQLQSAAADIAQGFLTGGVSEAAAATERQAKKAEAAAGSGDLQDAVTRLFLDKALSANIGTRTFGAVGNNNLELLFNGPSLRTFGFTFSFYPRSKDEAKMVRQIIRAFKQSMSVKRSKTSLLLKAPHTFAISYVTAGQKQHPYLNSFKECALTSCSVDYTPDGTYMTYGGTSDDDRSMTAYRLSLQFQELEPIFDDEYYEIDKNADRFIGF